MTKEQIYIEFITKELEKGNIQHKEVCDVFLPKFACSRQTFDKYWKKANEAYLERQQSINELKAKETLKSEIEATRSQIKTKLQIIDDLENEILNIEKTLKDGYLIKIVTINGETTTHKEIFGSREIEIWNRMLKDKRDLLIKLQGFEAPKKQAFTDTEGNDRSLPISGFIIEE